MSQNGMFNKRKVIRSRYTYNNYGYKNELIITNKEKQNVAQSRI